MGNSGLATTRNDGGASSTRAVGSRGEWRHRSSLQRFLELLGIAGLAVAQPALSVLGGNPQFFVVRRVSTFEVALLVTWFVLLPPVVAWVCEQVAGLAGVRVRAVVHVGLCGVFAGLLAVQVVHRHTGLTASRLLVVGLTTAAAAALLYVRIPVVGTFLRFLAVAPVLFVTVFLFVSPAAAVVTSDAGAPPAASGFATPHRVVVIVMDEFPEISLLDGTGHVDRAAFPNFAELADGSTWYRNSTTVAGFTEDAVPAILTGRYPSGSLTPTTADAHPRNLFSMLRGRYTVNGHETVTHLCTGGGCAGAVRDDARVLGDATDLWWQGVQGAASDAAAARQLVGLREASRADEVMRSFVGSLRASDRPTLDVVHVEIPHFPWTRLPTLQTYATGEGPEAAAASTLHAQHLLQVQAADTWIGRTMRRLRSVGAFDDAMVVVTADHGVGFQVTEPSRSPSAGNLAEVLWTPLFVKYPEQHRGRIDDRPVESVDIVPTIAEVVGAKGWHFDGRSLLGPPRTSERRRLYFGYRFPVRTPKDLAPPPGHRFLSVDGVPYFAAVLRSRVTAPDLPGDLRAYASGPYATLVGRDVGPLVSPTPAGATLTLPGLDRLRTARTSGRRLPWVWNEGTVSPDRGPQWIAVAVDGRVAAVSPTGGPAEGGASVAILVPPALVHGHTHTVTAFAVSGSATGPALRPMRVRGTGAR